jgi:hypothetical protein
MKKHLIEHIGDSGVDYHTWTYCGLDSEKWSEDFDHNVDKNLTRNINAVTCKRCIGAYKKEIEKHEKLLSQLSEPIE